MIPAALLALALCAPAGGPEGAPVPSVAESGAWSGARVLEVHVEGTRDEATRKSVMDVFGIAAGDTLDLARVRVGIKRVFLTGPWADVQVSGVRAPDGVRLRVVLVSDVVLTELTIAVRGGLQERLLNAAGLEVGSRFRPDRLAPAVERVRTAMASLGYPHARIEVEVEEPAPESRRVRMRVEPGRAVRVASFSVHGDPRLTVREIEGLLRVGPGAPFDRVALEQRIEGLRAVLLRRRHLAAQVQLEVHPAEASADDVAVSIFVEAGPRYMVRFVGNALLSDAALRTVLDEQKLKGVAPENLARARALVESAYRVAGHPRVRVSTDEGPALPPYADDAERELRVFIDEGPRSVVTEVLIDGVRAFPVPELVRDVWATVAAETPSPGLVQPTDPGDVDDLLATPIRRRGAPPPPFEVSDETLKLVPQPGIERKPIYLEPIYAEAARRLTDRYRSAGYLDADIEGPVPEFSDDGREIRVRYRVREGERVTLGTLRITDARPCATSSDADSPCAREPLPLQLLEPALKLRPGAPANFARVAEARSILERTLQDRGYPRARVSEAFERAPQAPLLDVVFSVDPGPFVTIGRVRFRGNERTRELVLLDRISLEAGDLYAASEVERSRQALARLGLFSAVSVDLMEDDPNARIRDLLVVLKERPPFALELGAGASAEDGPRAFLAGEARNIVGLGLSLRGRGQVNYPRAFYDFLYDPTDPNNPLARFPEEENELLAWTRFFEGQAVVTGELPKVYGLRPDTRLHVDTTVVREIRPAFTLNRAAVLGGADVQPADWLRVAPQAEAEFSDFDCPRDLRFGQSCGEGSIGLTRRRDAGFIRQTTWRLSFSVDLRDNPVRPRSGLWLSTTGDVAFGSGQLRVDDRAVGATDVSSDFFKLTTAVVGYVPVTRALTWALLARVGNILPIGNAYIPLFKRFYLGGTNSIRGFREDEILPADDLRWPAIAERPVSSDGTGNTAVRQSLGGQFVVCARSELRLQTLGDVEVGTFIDAGQLLDDVTRFAPELLAAGAGVGLRYNTPVGPLAMDLGWRVADGRRALPPPLSIERFNLHLSIGYF